MENFEEFLGQIENPQHRERAKEVFDWVESTFPSLERKVAWNQPMFTEHGTFIIGFSVAAKHLAISTERAGMERFADDIKQSGYGFGKMLFRIKWEETVDYSLLERMIAFNRIDKANCSTFWRK